MKKLIGFLIILVVMLTPITVSAMERGNSPYNSWRNVDELRSWLKSNNISEREYIKDVYDCEGFALDLVSDARADGKIIGLFAQDRKAHIMNFAIIGNYIYTIEPQNDRVKVWRMVDRADK